MSENLAPDRVLRWEVPVDDDWHSIGGGQVLHVACKPDRADVVHVWTLEPVDPAAEEPHRIVSAFGTGHHIDRNAVGDHLGTALALPLVWHVFEARRKP